MYATTAPGIDPTQSRPFIIVWSVFNLLACAGFSALAAIGLCARRRNAVLISFELAYALMTALNTILTWTGTVGSIPTPFTPCLIGGTLGTAMTPAPAVGACALVIKAWAHIMMAVYPRSAAFRWISSSALLAAFPWITSAPFLIVTLVIAVRDPSTIARTSPAYCTFTYPEVTNTIIYISLVSEVVALVLAAWTTVIIGLTRWRVRRGAMDDFTPRSGYYPLVIRTLFFSLFILGALGANLGAALTSWSNPTTDVAISLIYVLSVFVFASDPLTIRTVCGCSKDSRTPVSESSKRRFGSTLVFARRSPNASVSALEYELKNVGDTSAEVPDRSHKSSMI